MSNFIIALAVFVITIVGATFAVPYCIDWNGYRGVFEEEATRLLGREVRVGGAVNLHVLPTPYFRFEKVRIADTSLNLQEPFFRADSLTVRLNVAPLFRGAIEANEIEFQRPVLRLALNDQDGWNWQSFGAVLAQAPYVPTNVALASVKISSGVLALHGRDGIERTRFDGIDAELSTPALRGPYHLRGSLGAGAEKRELRLATAEPESDGSLRFKAILSSPASYWTTSSPATSYTLEGRLLDLRGKPRVAGEVSATLPVAGILRTAAITSAAGSATSEDARARGPAFELRASFTADAVGAELTDLVLSFEQEGRPQLISGTLKAGWRDALSVDMNLSSRWLDVDRIAAAGNPAGGPLASIIPLALRLRDLLPESRAHARLSIDQANLGGEAVSGLRIGLGRSQDRIEVEELRLSMPGGSRGELKGVVSGAPEAPQFDGSISLRGTSIVRFSTWATGGAMPFVAAGDGIFGVRSRLTITSGMAAASDIVGDLSGTAIGGAVQYRWQGRREVSLQLEAPQLDARAFVPAGSTLSDVFDLGVHGATTHVPAGEGARPAPAGGAAWRNSAIDAYLRLNAGRLITTDRTYRDVVAELEFRGGSLKLPLLRIAGEDGFALELEGEVENAASHPQGAVRGAFSVATPEGLAPMLALLGIGDLLKGDARAQAMAPLHLAGAMRFGRRTPNSTDLSLSGEVNGASVTINGLFDGSADGWRTGPADVTALIESADGGNITDLLLPGRSPPRAGGPLPGRLLIKGSGIPAQGLAALASLDTNDLALQFRGQLIAAATDTTATGDLEIKAADARRIALLAGMGSSLRLESLPLEGSLKLSASRSNLRFDSLAVRIGGSDVRGKLLLSARGERQHIAARFDLNELSLAQLLAPLQDARLAVTGAAEAAISGRESPWPDEPFEAGAFDALEGNISLTGNRLLLTEGVSLRDVSLDIALSAGELDVHKLEGLGLGGRVRADLHGTKVAGGFDVHGNLSIADAKLETIAANAGAKGSAAGGVTGEITFAGRGSSARSVMSVLEGRGTLRLSDATLATLWPGAIAIASEAALHAQPDKVGESLKEGLVGGLAAGHLPLPEEIALDIADGQLRIKPLVIDTPQGRASGGASLDLRTLALESDWRLEQTTDGMAAEKPPLPAVTVSYRAPLTSLGSRERRIATEALEREIAVRRVERDVEELERLRRIDETRRREDAERLRRQLEQTPPTVPVAPATPQGRPAQPG
jgi:uncharacterized protein involved in outer membrane biogenesis